MGEKVRDVRLVGREINPSGIPDSELVSAPWKPISKNKEFGSDRVECKGDESRCVNPGINVLLAFTDVLQGIQIRSKEKPKNEPQCLCRARLSSVSSPHGLLKSPR